MWIVIFSNTRWITRAFSKVKGICRAHRALSTRPRLVVTNEAEDTHLEKLSTVVPIGCIVLVP